MQEYLKWSYVGTRQFSEADSLSTGLHIGICLAPWYQTQSQWGNSGNSGMHFGWLQGICLQRKWLKFDNAPSYIADDLPTEISALVRSCIIFISDAVQTEIRPHQPSAFRSQRSARQFQSDICNFQQGLVPYSSRQSRCSSTSYVASILYLQPQACRQGPGNCTCKSARGWAPLDSCFNSSENAALHWQRWSAKRCSAAVMVHLVMQ